MRKLALLLLILPLLAVGQSLTPVATWGKFVVRAPVGTPGEINYYSRPRSGGWLRWNTFAPNDSANARLVCLSSDFFEEMIGDSMAVGRSWASSHLQAAGSYAASSHTHTASQVTDFNSVGDARWSLLAHTHAQSDVTGLVAALAAKQAALSGTGFVKISGSTISYDNSTYLTSEVDGSTTNEIEVASQTGNANKYLTTDGSTTSWRARSFTNNASRTIQTVAASGNGWQISSTRDAQVSYSVAITTTATIGGASSGYVITEIAATNSATAGDWQEVGRVYNGQTITLAIALQSVQVIGGTMTTIVPAGYYVRLRSVNVSATPSYSYQSGQEVTL